MTDQSPGMTTPKPRSNKLALLMGIDEDSAKAVVATAKKDKNFEVRSQTLQAGFQTPPAPLPHDVGGLYSKHRNMPNVWVPMYDDGKPDPSRRWDLYRAPPLMHMLVSVKQMMFNVGEACEIYFSLWSTNQNRFISEEFMLRLSMTGVVDDSKAPQKCIFSDVRAADMVNGNGLWVCARVYRLGVIDASKKTKAGVNDQAYRRPFGVAMLQLTQKMVTNPEGKENQPPNATLYIPNAEKDFATLHEVIIDKPQSIQPLKNSSGLALGITMFEGEPEDVRKNYTKETDKILFIPRSIQLDLRSLVATRHLLFLTLDLAEFGYGTKTTQKNMICKIQLRDSKLKPVPDCLARGMGHQVVKETEFSSTLYYHNNSPNYAERLCVWLPNQHLDKYHLFFDFEHVSSEAKKGHEDVALSWVPLVDEKGGFLPNNSHKLIIWSLSKKEGVNEQYMMWDAATKEKRNTKQVIVVHSQLSSTLASTDMDLYRVLHFNSFGWETVDSSLKSLLKKDVTLLLSCSSFLIEQLLELALADNYSDAKPSAVLALLFTLSSLAQSGTANAFILKDYLTHTCQSGKAYTVLLPTMRTLFAWCVSSRDGEFTDSNPQFQELTLAIKSLGAVICLIVKSYTIDEKTGDPPAQSKAEFRKSLMFFLNDIVKFVGKSSTKLGLLQRSVIAQMTRAVVDSLEPVCTIHEQAKFLNDFIDKIPLDDKYFSTPAVAAPSARGGMNLAINTGFSGGGGEDPLSPGGGRGLGKDLASPPLNRKASTGMDGLSLGAAALASPTNAGSMRSPGASRASIIMPSGRGDSKSIVGGPPSMLDSKGNKPGSGSAAGMASPTFGAISEDSDAGGSASTSPAQLMAEVQQLDDSISLIKLKMIRGLIGEGLSVASNTKRWRRHFFGPLFKMLKQHIDPEREINEQLAVVGVVNDLLAVLAEEYGPHEKDLVDSKGVEIKGQILDAPPPPENEEDGPPPPPPGDDDDDEKKASIAKAGARPSTLPGIGGAGNVQRPPAAEELDAKWAAERDQLFNLIPGVTLLLQKILKARQHKTLPQLEKRFLANIKTDAKEYIQDTTAVYLGLLNILAPHVDPFLIDLNNRRAGADSQFINQVYDVFQYLIKYSVFHKYWVMFRMLELNGTVKVLEWSGAYLIRFFLQENRFEVPLWRQHFQIGMAAALCEDATLEDVAENRRKYIQEKYGDVRLRVIDHYKSTWEWVQQKHVHLIEVLLGPAVDLTQSRLVSLRALGRDWYFDLIRAEWAANSSLKTVLYHTIDTVGRVVHDFGGGKLARGKEQMDDYMSFFENDLAKVLAGSPIKAMQSAGTQLIKDIRDLFQHLYSLESLPTTPEYEDDRTLACINLMSYLKTNGRQELYIKYVNYLSELHEKHNNFVEWGNTLHLHQSLLGWSNTELEEVGTLPAAAEADRKVALLQASMSAYDRGEFWERAIEISKDLATAYETKLFYISGVAALLRQQANYWEKIVAQDRIFRSFYRVKFHGAGFGPDIRNKEFVFRSGNGPNLESVKDFTDRIKKKYPEAIIANTPELPPGWVFGDAKKPGEYDEFDTSKPPASFAALGSDALKRLQYIQITTLSTSSPEELKNQPSKWDEIDAPTRLIRYHKQNNVDTFVYVRVSKKHKPEVKKGEKTNEFRDLWVIRTFLSIAGPLPSVRRRAEVIQSTEVLMSPIENAVFNIVTKNNEMREITADVSAAREGDKINTGPLSMNLAGVIDAAVMGGVEKYKEAFFDGTYLLINPTHGAFINQFKAALGKQIEILKHGLDVFGSKCDNTLVPLLTHLTKTYGVMCESLKNIVS